MMNTLYPAFKDRILTGALDWLSDTFAFALYDSGGVFDPSDALITDVGGNQIAPGNPLGGKEVLQGYVRCSPTTYFALTSAVPVVAAILYRVSDGALVAFFDEVVGFPLTPIGSDYVFAPAGPEGALFRL